MRKKLLLIDGHSIMNRAYYGVPVMTSSRGFHTNAVYGFLNIMFKLLEEEKPQYFAVAFDTSAPTFRHDFFEAYKSGRKMMPEELKEQIPVIKDILAAMNITTCEKPGLEADDILGTLARSAEKQGMDVALVSGDRDLLQTASEHICVRIPKTKGGKTEVENYFASDVLEKYGVSPDTFIELKALMGDQSDNISGVPGVGEKTAAELLREYGSIEGIYANLDNIGKKALREKLRDNRELLDRCIYLVTIRTDAELPVTVDDCEIKDIYTTEAADIFRELELKKLLESYLAGIKQEEKHKDIAVWELTCREELTERFLKPEDSEPVSAVPFYSESDRADDGLSPETAKKLLLGAAFAVSDREAFLVRVSDSFGAEELAGFISELVHRKKVLTFDSKKLYPFCEEEDSYNIHDEHIAAYLVNPLKSDCEIADISSVYGGVDVPAFRALFPKKNLREAFADAGMTQYACLCAAGIYAAYDSLTEALDNAGMTRLYNEIELPLSWVLYSMERYGIGADGNALRDYSRMLGLKTAELEQAIHDRAGTPFNINSPKQLGEILFEKLGLPGGKKTKTGYSTAADVLEKLAPEHAIVRDILEYRMLSKLKSTYADGLAGYIASDGRIHTSFNQTITATGRISSTEPNLQNIPMRTESGRQIRKVFKPEEGCVFMDADYSQIELRILAHMSGDEQLIEAYRCGEDIHRITASKVFGVPFEDVTDLQRRNAKAVNFGIVYGISSFGLGADLNISRKEAERYIEDYFSTYPGVKAFLDGCISSARETGCAVTLYGRKRPIPELKAGNFIQRSFGERVAMNSPIQGTAADIMKIAMIGVYRELKRHKLKSRLILQIHDELLLEVYKGEEEQAETILREQMQKACDLKVSLLVDLHTGSDWYEAKS